MGRRAARDETWPLEDDFPLEVLGDFRGFSGWWFGTFFPYIGNTVIIPTDFHIFQRG